MGVSKVKSVVLIILTSLSICVFILNFVGSISWQDISAHEIGIPDVSYNESNYINSSITQIVSTQDNIFLVYGYKSAVQVYSSEGKFQYCLKVYNHQNGRLEIAVENSVLYICDKVFNVYVFSGEHCIDFVDKENSSELCNTLAFGNSSPSYKIKAGSVWYVSDNSESHCIIARPIWHSLYQNNFLDLLLLILLILIGFVLYFPSLAAPPKQDR